MFDKTGRGLITWRELSSLLKALGIPDIPVGLLNRMAVEFTPENSPGLEYKPFLNLIYSDSFSSTLDYTYNRHNSTYNIRVMKKAISLLVDSFLTLEDLRAARLGFTLYEGETCNGIQLEAGIVSSAMRVTGKAIAPKKLQIWLDSIEEDVPGRNEQNKAVPNVTSTVERSKFGLFELTDSNFLLTPGQKLSKHMDEDYDSMVNLINSQQIPPRETLTSAKNKSSSPDNYLLQSRNTKRVEEGLDLYGQIRESLRSSTSHVQNSRAVHSSARSMSTRPHSVAEERRSHLPTLHLNTSVHTIGRRSISAPSIRSVDSQKTVRIADTDSIDARDPIPRHMTTSAPLLRGGFIKADAFDDGEFAIPERRMQKYETLREYIALNGEASLSRAVTSSIGASYKQSHMSAPSSPHFGKTEERKKKNKPKRAFEEGKRNSNLSKSFQAAHKDHRFSVDSLANNLEDIINTNKPYNTEITRAPSTKKSSMPNFDDGGDLELPSLSIPSSTQEGQQVRNRPKNENLVRSITFNLNNAGD